MAACSTSAGNQQKWQLCMLWAHTHTPMIASVQLFGRAGLSNTPGTVCLCRMDICPVLGRCAASTVAEFVTALPATAAVFPKAPHLPPAQHSAFTPSERQNPKASRATAMYEVPGEHVRGAAPNGHGRKSCQTCCGSWARP
eukprot:350888-Chlamydomonas_euryale.AAC.2